jgi:hypothetical protein
MSPYSGLPVGGGALRIMSVVAISVVAVISMPAHAAELSLNPGVYPGIYPGIVYPGVVYPGVVAPAYVFPPAREAAPGTGWALDGVRNGTTREERDRHGGPEIDLTGRPLLTGRYREFKF